MEIHVDIGILEHCLETRLFDDSLDIAGGLVEITAALKGTQDGPRQPEEQSHDANHHKQLDQGKSRGITLRRRGSGDSSTKPY